LYKLIKESLSLLASKRVLLLEMSKFLEDIYYNIIMQGDFKVLKNAKEEVDYHYIYFVYLSENNYIYKLNSNRIRPINRGILVNKYKDILG
jgi:hypothetical protein